MFVIRNINIKVVFRLLEGNDRVIIGILMVLNDN